VRSTVRCPRDERVSGSNAHALQASVYRWEGRDERSTGCWSREASPRWWSPCWPYTERGGDGSHIRPRSQACGARRPRTRLPPGDRPAVDPGPRPSDRQVFSPDRTSSPSSVPSICISRAGPGG
jgi:hypothetical protein